MGAKRWLLWLGFGFFLCTAAAPAGEPRGLARFFRRRKPAPEEEEQKRRPPADAPVIRHRRFAISYSLSEAIVEDSLQKVELFVTTDLGLSWTNYGADPDRTSPFVVAVDSDGIYGFALVSTDRAGNQERPPLPGVYPEQVVIVDTAGPTGRFTAPLERTPLPAEGVTIAWETEDEYTAATGVEIHVSGDEGAKWYLVKKDLPARGHLVWKPPVDLAPTYIFRLQVRDRAGNVSRLSCPGAIVTDTRAPEARVTGPSLASAKEVSIQYTLSDGPQGSGVRWVELWTTVDGGATWTAYGRDEDLQSPMAYTNTDAGEVGFRLRAADAVGNVTPVPEAGTAPDLSLVFDTTAPVVTLAPFADGRRFLAGGSTVSIGWEAEDPNLAARPVTLSWSGDGGQSWQVLAAEQDAAGSHEWSVPTNPDRNLNNCLLRVTAADSLGNVGMAESAQPFSILSQPPDVPIRKVEALPVQPDGTAAEEEEVLPIESLAPATEGASAPAPHPSAVAETAEPLATPADVEEDDSAILVVPGTTPAEAEAARAREEAERREAAARRRAEEEARQEKERLAREAIERETRETTRREREKAAAEAARLERARAAEAERLKQEADRIAAEEAKRIAEEEAARAAAEKERAAALVEEREAELRREREAEAAAAREREARERAAREKEAAERVAQEREAAALEKVPPPSAPVEPRVERAPAPNRESALALVRQGDLALEDGEPDRARELYTEALQAEANLAEAQVGLGRVARVREDYAAALSHAEKAYALDTGHVPAYLLAGQVSLRASKAARAREREGEQLRADPSDLQRIREERVRHLRNAVAAFRRVTELAPREKLGYDGLGDTFYFKAKLAADASERNAALFDAQEAFLKGYNIGTPNYREAFHLGVIHYRREQFPAAQRYLLRAVEVCPAEREPKECYWYLAEIYAAQGQPDDSLYYWRKTKESYDPQDPVEAKFHKRAAERVRALERQLRR